MKSAKSRRAWAELRDRLARDGTLRPRPGQPLLLPDGTAAGGLFYPWQVTLTGEGAQLAAACLLQRLGNFEARQLAACGQAGTPLVAACLALGGRRYRGLLVREERKPYGSQRRVEGPLDQSQPVVILDDVLGSGKAIMSAIAALEEEGLQVEGAVVLVNCAGYGGAEQLAALGYRVEWVFEAGPDLGWAPARAAPLFRAAPPARWGRKRVPDGLHPAVAARYIAQAYLPTGHPPRPPRRFDAPYDSSGGVFVSFRDRLSDERICRDGFWHFDPRDADPGRDLALATIRALRGSSAAFSRRDLDDLKIAVTWCGQLERVSPGQLDFARFGIVVRSSLDGRLGGALPNTQRFTNEVEQYHHARSTNAGVPDFAPHELYRHTLAKCIEPGASWPHFGAELAPANDWTRRDEIGAHLVERAQTLLRSLRQQGRVRGRRLPDDLIPAPIFGVGVTLYQRGVVGCGVSWGAPLDDCLREAVATAWQDKLLRRRHARETSGKMSLAVSILHDREWLGVVPATEAAAQMRAGVDALGVVQDRRAALFLPAVMVYANWSKEETARALLEKAGIRRGPQQWAVLPTTSWLRHAGREWRLRFGQLDRSEEPYPPERWRDDIALLGAFLFRQQRRMDRPGYWYWPETGESIGHGDAARLVHAWAALHRAGEVLHRPAWMSAAQQGLGGCLAQLRATGSRESTLALPNWESSAMADCLLLAATKPPMAPPGAPHGWHRLGARVRSLLLADGRITDLPAARGVAADHDHLPGAALLALVRLAEVTRQPNSLSGLDHCLRWYRRRFSLVHPWGMVGWQPQGWAAVHAHTGKRAVAEFVCEIADYALGWQHEKSGAFVIEWGEGGFSFLTAFLAEGLADAWAVADRMGWADRCQRYRRSCGEALRFMNRLIIRPEDTFWCCEPEQAVGGVRRSPTTTDVRIDYVSHTLMALLKARQMETRRAR